jgi:hypothetical protein
MDLANKLQERRKDNFKDLEESDDFEEIVKESQVKTPDQAAVMPVSLQN